MAKTLSMVNGGKMSLEIHQNPESHHPTRSRAALVAELNQVADEGSRAFWRFWRGMTQEEKAVLLHGPEEEQVAVGR